MKVSSGNNNLHIIFGHIQEYRRWQWRGKLSERQKSEQKQWLIHVQIFHSIFKWSKLFPVVSGYTIVVNFCRCLYSKGNCTYQNLGVKKRNTLRYFLQSQSSYHKYFKMTPITTPFQSWFLIKTLGRILKNQNVAITVYRKYTRKQSKVADHENTKGN